MPVSPDQHASLCSAAQYVRAFRGKTFVFKLGGEVLGSAAARRQLCEQLTVLWSFSIRVVLVHGGGTHLDALCRALGLPVEKVDGRRITTREVLQAAKMVFAGSLHTDLLADLHAAGIPAAGVSGVDAGLLRARRRPATEGSPDFGHVGDIEAVRPELLLHLLEGGYVPVVAPLSADDQGAVFNTNADTVAAEIAVALGAEKLFFLLDVPGLLEEVARPTSLVPCATLADLARLEGEGRIGGGMLPKLAAVRRALGAGVASAHLVSGIATGAVLTEVFTNEGSGTMIVAAMEQPAECAA